MTTQKIKRNTKVVSVSLDPVTLALLDKLRKNTKQTRSSFFAFMLNKYAWDQEWAYLRKVGEETAKKFNITSEEDVYRIMGDV